jgi:hypothetical protein
VGDKKQRVSIKERFLSRATRSKSRTAGRKWNWVGMLKVAVIIGLLAAESDPVRAGES